MKQRAVASHWEVARVANCRLLRVKLRNNSPKAYWEPSRLDHVCLVRARKGLGALLPGEGLCRTTFRSHVGVCYRICTCYSSELLSCWLYLIFIYLNIRFCKASICYISLWMIYKLKQNQNKLLPVVHYKAACSWLQTGILIQYM